MQEQDESLAGDLLFGAEAIGNYLGLSPRQIYHQQDNLGIRHVGSVLVASKRQLRKLLTGCEAA